MDAFKDRLSQRARDTSRPALAHQSRGRGLSETEAAFAADLMAIMGDKVHDFERVSAELTQRGTIAPHTGRQDWDVALLTAELATLNADLDAAYQENGFGA